MLSSYQLIISQKDIWLVGEEVDVIWRCVEDPGTIRELDFLSYDF